MADAKPVRRRGEKIAALSAARLHAVQALYQMAVAGGEPLAVIGEFLAHRLGEGGRATDEGEGPLAPADAAHFRRLVEGVTQGREVLDAAIAGALDPSWPIGRLETVLLCVLRCGAFELAALAGVPTGAIIDEYVEVARAFYGGREPGFVNGVLDKLARTMRAGPAPAEEAADGGVAGR